jgi:hypothetical protein
MSGRPKTDKRLQDGAVPGTVTYTTVTTGAARALAFGAGVAVFSLRAAAAGVFAAVFLAGAFLAGAGRVAMTRLAFSEGNDRIMVPDWSARVFADCKQAVGPRHSPSRGETRAPRRSSYAPCVGSAQSGSGNRWDLPPLRSGSRGQHVRPGKTRLPTMTICVGHCVRPFIAPTVAAPGQSKARDPNSSGGRFGLS